MRDTLQTSHLNTNILAPHLLCMCCLMGSLALLMVLSCYRGLKPLVEIKAFSLLHSCSIILCLYCSSPTFFRPTGNGQNPQPPESLCLPPCACPISIWQCPDGHEERVLLCRLQTGHGLPQGEVSTYINLLMITVSSWWTLDWRFRSNMCWWTDSKMLFILLMLLD